MKIINPRWITLVTLLLGAVLAVLVTYELSSRFASSTEVRSLGTYDGASSGEGSPTFAVIGDSGTGGGEQRAVARLLERSGPDFVLLTGDVVYEAGAQKDYGAKFFAPYRNLLKQAPIFPTLGNHDVATDNGAPYLKNFQLPSNNPQGTERYYSFDRGNAHFVSLDSELYYDDGGGSPAEQKAWLALDLAATDKTWKFVFFHRPPYSSSEHGSDLTIRRNLAPVFEKYGVDIVFNGHDHDYERTVPINGVTYVVSGGGGKELYRAGKSNWTAYSAFAHHAVFVSVNGNQLSMQAVSPNGNVMDRLHLDSITKNSTNNSAA